MLQTGTISSLKLDNGYGFIRTKPDEPAIFFHISGLDRSLPFDQTLLERRVTFSLETTNKGPRAVSIRAA